MNPRTFFWSLTGLGVALDLLSKDLAFRWLGYPGECLVIPGFLDLHTTKNPGGVFGILPGSGFIFIPLSFLALGVVYWLFVQTHHQSARLAVSLALISAGTLGNLYDRLTQDGVRDFIDVHVGTYYWPTFNVADIFICTGSALLILFMLLEPRVTQEAKPNATEEPKQ